jgi:hypothetical protein
MTKQEIIRLCDFYYITDYIIKKDMYGLYVDVEGNVDLSCAQGTLINIPLRFGHVSGSFSCIENKITSLIGSPWLVGGGFHCSENKLTSLVGSPALIKGYFSCGFNKITTLIGGPESVDGGFYCNDNHLTDLVGCPSSLEWGLYCSHNNLTSLVGCPTEMGGIINCSDNNLLDTSYYHLFEMGYENDDIFPGTTVDLIGIKRQWVIQSIIKG